MQYECVLISLNNQEWINTIKSYYIANKLVLHSQPNQYTSPTAALSDPNLFHSRYDAALIYVNPESISIWRAALANTTHKPTLPLIIYAADLKSQALKDFLYLGACDFISPPFYGEELRTRIENAALRSTNSTIEEKKPIYNSQTNNNYVHKLPETEQSLCDSILERSGTELEAYAVALATQRATNSATFKAAKNQIIAHFESAYIKASLNRYGGNVTQAARMAQKHRRAFWALMKKHNIDPNPYRIN